MIFDEIVSGCARSFHSHLFRTFLFDIWFSSFNLAPFTWDYGLLQHFPQTFIYDLWNLIFSCMGLSFNITSSTIVLLCRFQNAVQYILAKILGDPKNFCFSQGLFQIWLNTVFLCFLFPFSLFVLPFSVLFIFDFLCFLLSEPEKLEMRKLPVLKLIIDGLDVQELDNENEV